MNKTEAKEKGISEGRGAIRYCEVGESDRKEAGCGCVAPKVCEECLAQAAYESEQNSRQYSPFEFFAHAVNESGDRADGLWESYEEGVGIGIRSGMKSRLERENN